MSLEDGYPTIYRPQIQQARKHDRHAADLYFEHTTIGDPPLDRVIESLSDLPSKELNKFLKAGIEQEQDVLKRAPKIFREFFDDHVGEPDWLDFEAHRPAITAFHLNAVNILTGFVTGVLVEGFTTLIAKSFETTGRLRQPGSARRRLSQNNRHMLECYMPSGLKRYGDGWKLSTRLRFVHAQVRHLIQSAEDIWDKQVYGTPLSAAHLGFAATEFSARKMQLAEKLGTVFTEDERASVMALWRYTSYVMGIPESILFKDYSESQKVWQISFLCEPHLQPESVRMCNDLIKAIPIAAGISDPKEHEETINLGYTLSRALIGNKLADKLNFPPRKRTALTLPFWRLRFYFDRLVRAKSARQQKNFSQLLEISAFDGPDTGYRLPNHVYSEKSDPW